MNCHYAYYLEYVRRLTPIEEKDYFRWGRLVHEAREAIDNQGIQYIDKAIEDTIEKIRGEIERGEYKCTPKVIEEYEYMFDALPGVFNGWLLRWKKQLFDYEVYGAEKVFELILWEGDINGENVRIVFKGKIDNIVRQKSTGIEMTWEIKTAAQTGESYYFKKQLDGQPVGYLYAAQHAIGHNVNRTMYEVFKKPQKPKHWSQERYFKHYSTWAVAENKKAFERRIIYFTQQQIDEYRSELMMSAELIAHSIRDGLWPRHHPGNLLGSCAYQTICLKGEQSCAERDNYYTRDAKHLHPEL